MRSRRGHCRTCGTTPTPYYEEPKRSLVQDHAAIFRDTQYAAGIEIKEEFIIPAIDTDIQVCLKNIVNVVVGSYIWSPAYGYLKIVHWDACTGKIGLLNEDITGGAIPGTVVSECSLWAVTARPCCVDEDNFSLFPFLAENYVIPAVSGSVTLAVTSTFGLIEGTNVRIGSNVYLLDTINSSLEIVVTNEGAGGVPGTIVEARDVNGDLQYLITSALISACVIPGSETVRLVGCDGASQVILEGEYVDQVPVLINSGTEEVEFKLLDTSVRVCTSLIAAVNITPAVGTYTFSVADASIFTVGEFLEVQSSSIRFEITNIAANDIDVDSIPNPSGVTQTLQAGEWVCLILTTEELQNEIDDITTVLDLEYLRLDGTNEASLADNTLTLPKLQTIATDRLLGRDTVGIGDVEELTVGGGLEFSGSGGIQRAALTGDVTAPAASGSTTIANNAVTTVKIADSNVTTVKIADSNITTIKIADANVTEAKLADDAATRSTLLGQFIMRKTTPPGSGAFTGLMVIDFGAYLDNVFLAAISWISMPKNCKVTHLSIASGLLAPGGGNSCTGTLFKNGVTTGKSVTLSGTTLRNQGSIVAENYAPGDYIEVELSATDNVDEIGIAVHVWGHFIE